MRIVIAVGGDALLRRGEPMTTEVQRRNIRVAAGAIAPLAAGHGVVVAPWQRPAGRAHPGLLHVPCSEADGLADCP